jgi:hypothetical protein
MIKSNSERTEKLHRLQAELVGECSPEQSVFWGHANRISEQPRTARQVVTTTLSGNLVIDASGVSYRLSSRSQAKMECQEVRHVGSRILVRKMRLCPAPWFNTYVFIHGDVTSVRVIISAFARPKLRQALRRAGIELDECWTWLLPGPPMWWTQ